MAITASISLAEATIGYNQQSSYTLTVSNSGLADVTVVNIDTNIKPSAAPNYESRGLFQASALPKGFGQVFTSPASSSVDIPVSFVVFSPQVTASSSALASPTASYKVGC